MKVSLILTTYNSKDFLPRTLSSIDSQDHDDIEVVIKDGGSTDGTLELIEEYASRSRFEVKHTSCQDTGIYDAMNQGYALTTGDIIVCFNDVFVSGDVVSRMVKTIEEAEACGTGHVVGAHADLVYADDTHVVRKWKMGPQKSIFTGWMPGHPTLFLKREIYEKYGLYKTDYRISADYEFMIRFLADKKANNRLAYLPVNIISMFYGGTSTGSGGSYIKSLIEGHRALITNGVHPAFVADIMRTIRVLLQFVIK